MGSAGTWGQACKLQFARIYPFTNSATSFLPGILNSSDSPIFDLADSNRRLADFCELPPSTLITRCLAGTLDSQASLF
jgi:hypothetical protein